MEGSSGSNCSAEVGYFLRQCWGTRKRVDRRRSRRSSSWLPSSATTTTLHTLRRHRSRCEPDHRLIYALRNLVELLATLGDVAAPVERDADTKGRFIAPNIRRKRYASGRVILFVLEHVSVDKALDATRPRRHVVGRSPRQASVRRRVRSTAGLTRSRYTRVRQALQRRRRSDPRRPTVARGSRA